MNKPAEEQKDFSGQISHADKVSVVKKAPLAEELAGSSTYLVRTRRIQQATELLEQWHELTMITIHDNQSVFQGSKVATSIFQRKVPPKGANFDFFMGQKSLFPTETLPTNFFETVSKNVSNLQQ